MQTRFTFNLSTQKLQCFLSLPFSLQALHTTINNFYTMSQYMNTSSSCQVYMNVFYMSSNCYVRFSLYNLVYQYPYEGTLFFEPDSSCLAQLEVKLNPTLSKLGVHQGIPRQMSSECMVYSGLFSLLGESFSRALVFIFFCVHAL